MKTVKTLSELKELSLVSDQDIPQLEKVAEKFNISITPQILSLFTSADDNDPIYKQFVPTIEELSESINENVDPTSDKKFEKVKGVVHRYPDRCLLKPVSVCPVYCRFCFRKEMIGPGKKVLNHYELNAAYEYIKSQPEIWEVILTGGDPFILKPHSLGKIIQSLTEIAHVEVLRIHTRIPIVEPTRITEEMLNALKTNKALYVALHANHPDEFTPEAIATCQRIVASGIPMLSQSVLLKGINDDPETLTKLMKTFVRNRIKPYYLHHPDFAKGTKHFRLSIEEGQQLMKALQGKISGLCQPAYMLEIPGGAGKMPIGPCYMQAVSGQWMVEDYQGVMHCYVEDL